MTFGPCHTDGNCCGPGSYCCTNNAPHKHPAEDFATAPIDTERDWPNTVESCRDVEDWEVVQNDPEAQAALREAGL